MASRTPLRLTVAALGFVLLAPSAPASAAKAKRLPSVTSVKPRALAVGDTLQVRGRNFLPGRDKNTVVFQRTGGKAVFVKARIGTRKLLKVTLPDRLAGSLVAKDGAPAPTRFRLRVLSARFGKRSTRASISPLIGPKAAPAAPGDPTGQPPKSSPEGDCDGNGVTNRVQADDDGDLLDDATEKRFNLDGCSPDTDDDGVFDGYEYQSARDLNDDRYGNPNLATPYPGKRPYPNPLDREDAGTDFDGDVLTLAQEFALWKGFGDRNAGLDALNYSDGKQCSVEGMVAATYDKQREFLAWAASAGYARIMHPGGGYDPQPAGLYDLLDVNHDGVVRSGAGAYLYSEATPTDFDDDGLLCDNERDEDADGLSNYDEGHGRTTRGYWTAQYDAEKPFGNLLSQNDLADPDSDGDGVRDGADDLDFDDLPNLVELSRLNATGDELQGVAPRSLESKTSTADATGAQPQGRVNPFNPCLPNQWSRTCLRHPPFGSGAPAPFDESPDYRVYN